MITIRTARLADVPTLTKLWSEFVKDQTEIIIRNNPNSKPYLVKRPDAAKNFSDWAQRKVRSRSARVYIAEVDGKPAGFSLIFIRTGPPIMRLRGLGYIDDLFVKEEYRGLGISSKLYREATKWFRQKGMRHVALTVGTGNEPAHSIYKKWGFFDYHVEMRKKL